MKTIRDGQFELLRLIAMWMIVLYHLLLYFTVDYQSQYPVYKAAQIPLHVGVALFLLISGYFGIRPSTKGLVKLLSKVFLYSVPLAIVLHLWGRDFEQFVKDLLFVSVCKYWFVRTYVYLYLLSPIINKYLNMINDKTRLCFILVLVYISVWVGLTQGDESISGGKNIVNFILLYTIGDTLKVYKNIWPSLHISLIGTLYFCLMHY